MAILRRQGLEHPTCFRVGRGHLWIAGETDVTLRKAAEAAERLVKEAEEKVHQMEEKLRFEHLRAKWIRADLEAGDAKSAAETHAAVADAAKLESPAKAELFGPLGR